MTYSIVYVSATGNTELLARALRRALVEPDCVYYGPPSKSALDADLIFAGFWTDKGACPAEMKDFLSALRGKKAALFGTAGFGGDPDYFNAILRRVSAFLPDSCALAGGYMCQGRLPPSIRTRYQSMLDQNPEDERLLGLLKNYEASQSHPDAADLDGISAFARGLA